MIKITAVLILIFVPLIWGILMVSVMDYLEKKVRHFLTRGNHG